jgi:hypothetical protein
VRKPKNGVPPDKGWRIAPAGVVLLLLLVASFVLGALTGDVIFYVAGCIFIAMVFGGWFTSSPAWLRGPGDD